MDQTPQLADVPELPRPGALDDAPPLGPFRTFQTRIRDIAVLTGLALDHPPVRQVLPDPGILEYSYLKDTPNGSASLSVPWRTMDL